jgi:hypothetical protein
MEVSTLELSGAYDAHYTSVRIHLQAHLQPHLQLDGKTIATLPASG